MTQGQIGRIFLSLKPNINVSEPVKDLPINYFMLSSDSVHFYSKDQSIELKNDYLRVFTEGSGSAGFIIPYEHINGIAL